MSFKCGIVGLPNVGKSTLFNALTNSSKAQAANFPFCTIDPNVGIVAVPDERLHVCFVAPKSGIVEIEVQFLLDLGSSSGTFVYAGLSDSPTYNSVAVYYEQVIADPDENDDVSLDENGEQVALTRPCTVQLEQASCDGGLQSFCCEYPVMCGEDGDQSQCETAPAPHPAMTGVLTDFDTLFIKSVLYEKFILEKLLN